MQKRWPRLLHHAPSLLAWAVASLLGGLLLARLELAQQRDAFETDARIAHRLLSQQVVQHDAVLAMLALLQPASDRSRADDAMQRLPSVYPQILQVLRSDAATPWADTALVAAQARSRAARRAVLVDADFARGRYRVLLAAEPASYALQIELRSMVPWSEWPMAIQTSPVRVALEQDGQRFELQPGHLENGAGGWLFDFHKHLAADSQAFDVVAERRVGWAELPWWEMLAWAVLVAAGLAAVAAWRRLRAARRRAEELLRLGQVARLNTLGELAAGMAHELNQPLTALLANTQAARRLLDEEPPELSTARAAMARVVEQARRAADVVGRLRRAVERPDAAAQMRPIDLLEAARNALYLLEPEVRRRGVEPQLEAGQAGVQVLADPVALEQIVHNLLMNALQALDQLPAGQRRLSLVVTQQDRAPEPARGLLSVEDNGPGIAADLLPRIFEPFVSTRSGGLGLGLSLCETLAGTMGGALSAHHAAVRGAVFRLSLPLAPPTATPG